MEGSYFFFLWSFFGCWDIVFILGYIFFFLVYFCNYVVNIVWVILCVIVFYPVFLFLSFDFFYLWSNCLFLIFCFFMFVRDGTYGVIDVWRKQNGDGVEFIAKISNPRPSEKVFGRCITLMDRISLKILP